MTEKVAPGLIAQASSLAGGSGVILLAFIVIAVSARPVTQAEGFSSGPRVRRKS
ncbi:hypothetical protein [Mesorhizobium sp. WSM3860]|uniref:hypothetical protein n=1 Tax=Mesorhizobium sp. WSM3860 TaxID=2029403 RepID=UPI001596D42D|nr:hypothetical protein [Mesorhizobium sp. WSM3860]